MKWSLAPWERPAILGDLNEEFQDLVERKGLAAARRWFWQQALRSTWPNLTRRLRGDQHRLIMWILAASLMLYDSLFSKRLRGRTVSNHLQNRRQKIVWSVGYVAVMVALATIADALDLNEAQLATGTIVFLLVLFAWPRRARTAKEFTVRHKLTADVEREALLAVTVPNVPLGLSELVLSRGAVGEPGTPMHAYDEAPDDEFSNGESVRVYAVANLSADVSAVALVELIDSDRRVVRSIKVAIVRGALEQTSDNWSDFADNDPADHFGQIDVKLALAGLAPGVYRVRMSVLGQRTTVQERPIVIRDRVTRRLNATLRFHESESFITRLSNFGN